MGLEGERETGTLATLDNHVLVSPIDSFCLVSMMTGREKRDLSERKWGSWAEN